MHLGVCEWKLNMAHHLGKNQANIPNHNKLRCLYIRASTVTLLEARRV